jgi:hypothetical protein
LIAIDDISAVTDADFSFFRQRQLQELCAHFGLDVRGKVEVLSRRDRRDGKPSTPPPEDRKQPALLLPPTTPQTYAAAAAGAPHTAPDDSDTNTTTASPRTITAVEAVDNLEEDSSLAVENSFLEEDSQDLPGSATAPSTTSQPSDQLQEQMLASPRFTAHISISKIVQQELAPTATSVHKWLHTHNFLSTSLALLV